MSAETVARWNAIPMERLEDGGSQPSSSLKRTRDNYEASMEQNDDEDDDISLVSRTPSPVPPESMDVDKYDEYHRGPEREVITVDTKIKPDNIGFAMLAKLGWTEGQPLGLSGDGRVEPVPFYIKNDFQGLGKASQDVQMIETTVSQRREMDSEKQTKETEEQKKARQDVVLKRTAIKAEISTTLRAFYCELCDKQFKNVAQYDEHTNSYAHHHKARLRDAQPTNLVTQEDAEKRKEKERKREEKELRKVAKAAGIKIAKPASLAAPGAPGISPAPPPDPPKPSPASTSAWSSSVYQSPEPSVGFKKSGWGTVGPQLAAPSSTPSASTRTPGGWSSVSNPTPAHNPPPPPSFQTGGWSSLDAGNQPPATPATSANFVQIVSSQSSQPLRSAGFTRSSWAAVPPASREEHPQYGSQTASESGSTNTLLRAPPPNTPEALTTNPGVLTQSTSKKAPRRDHETSRSGWQQFKGGRRK